MVMILTAYTEFEPELAKIVIKTCSFKLKGPGFSENDQFEAGIRINFLGSFAAIRIPIGRTTI